MLAALASLPHTWAQYRVRRYVGPVALRRLTTDHGSVVVFSHEDDSADPAGVLVLRWVTQAHALTPEPPRAPAGVSLPHGASLPRLGPIGREPRARPRVLPRPDMSGPTVG